MRSWSDCTRSEAAMLVPKRSAWISMATSASTSSTPVRSARLRSARSLVLPARSSSITKCNSSASTALFRAISAATLASAASMASPASTHTVIKSSASGKLSKMSRWRRLIICASTILGR
ncbi:hypothetical protein D3C81_1882130 [compost metagenome]